MGRVSLTLDPETEARLVREAHRAGLTRASLARQLLRRALEPGQNRERSEALERRRKLAADYVAGRPETSALLKQIEVGALELWAKLDEP